MKVRIFIRIRNFYKLEIKAEMLHHGLEGQDMK